MTTTNTSERYTITVLGDDGSRITHDAARFSEVLTLLRVSLRIYTEELHVLTGLSLYQREAAVEVAREEGARLRLLLDFLAA